MLVLLAGTIAFSASKMLYNENAVGKIKVGVVVPEEDRLATMALSMVESLDSVKSLCEFQYVDEKQGEAMLKKGEVFALLKIPEKMVQKIIDGTNTPAVIVFSDNAGLEAAVFKTLAEAGTSILGTSQAAIYGTDELLTLHERETSIKQAEKELNALYLKYALSREGYFNTVKVSAAGDLPVTVFYGISAAVLVLLLMGIPAASMLRPYSRTMEQKLYMMGIGRVKRTAVRTLTLFTLLLISSAIPFFWCAAKGYMGSLPQSLLLWLLVCLAAAGWILMLYELAQNTVAGILVLFFTTVVMLFLSGGFVPGVFLPETLEKLGTFLPTSFLMEGIRGMVKGGGFAAAVKLVAMEALVFFVSAAVRRDYE